MNGEWVFWMGRNEESTKVYPKSYTCCSHFFTFAHAPLYWTARPSVQSSITADWRLPGAGDRTKPNRTRIRYCQGNLTAWLSGSAMTARPPSSISPCLAKRAPFVSAMKGIRNQQHMTMLLSNPSTYRLTAWASPPDVYCAGTP